MASGDAPHLPELRTVLLGSRGSGKSSSANTILGREEFEPRSTAQCVKRQGEVAGRQVTMVNTPGWNYDHPVERTIELVKQEIVRSVTMCPPGPHAFLLFIGIQSTSYSEEERISVEQHLQLLTDRVWSHTIVVFTPAECLGDTTIEQHIERREALQCLVKKCGNRYHILNIENKVATQVTELLDKMEKMAAGNGSHFEIDREILERMEVRVRAEEERAQERMRKMQEQRKTLRSQMGGSPFLSELRMVLLGYGAVGKSSSANTIVGREFDLRRSAHCVKRQGEVAERRVTVIDTPCWFVNIRVEITTAMVKQEIVRSVSLCPPGPHTLLLVIRLDRSFTEHHQKSIEVHLQLLSERVWSHTMVLFTCGDWLGDTSIEQHIEREGTALQTLVEKCGNRYHVLNNQNTSDVTQVTELLDKIEEVVAGNGGDHYGIDREILESIEGRRRAEEERARQRLVNVQKQRETLRSQMANTPPISELRIVLLGWRFVGKSTSGNTILGRGVFNLKRTTQSVKNQREVAGVQVTVVDTPGWLVNLPAEVTSELVKQEIVRSVSLCLPGPHAFLLVIRLDESFTEEHRRSLVGHLQLLSDRVWGHAIVLFICGNFVGDATIEQHIEREGTALQWLVEKCGNRYHIVNNWNRDDVTQVTELLDKMKEMVAGNGGDHYEIDKEILTLERRRESSVKKAMKKEEDMTKERQKLRTSMGDSLRLSELSIVLLGCRRSGKTSSGNTILGREEFDLMTAAAAQCVKRQGEVAERQVTVVDTPGWWANLPAEDTPELVKQEIVRSVSLCPKGTHTLLLVVPLVISFTEEIANAVEEHLELLGEKVWSRTLVVFTGGDSLGDTSIEQHIVREGKVLQWLIVKCGNRYHVLNNDKWGEGTQVTELLEKIEEMVARNAVPDIDGRGGQMSPQESTPVDDHTSEDEPQTSPDSKPNPGPAHGWKYTPQGPPPSILKPVLSTRPTEPSYRLQCPHAGLFQCSLTGLGFQMEGPGDILYSCVQWDEGLLSSIGQTPAGPLFSIGCPQGSYRQLHLPHCEILSGEGLESLSVAHVRGYYVDLLPPLRLTDTHVVVEITQLSLWGLVRESPLITIRGQVLPFLKSLGPLRSILNLIVLPANIPLKEVERTQKGSAYVPVYSDCTLTRGESYSVCCDVVERNKIKEGVQDDWSYSPTYPPTFQVFLRADTDEVMLKLRKQGGQGEEVWAARIPLTGAFLMCDRQTEAQTGSAEDQLRSARKEFVKRVSKSVIDDLLDSLLDKRVINENEMVSVKAELHKTEKARDVIDMIMSKGAKACSVMITIMYDLDNCLYQTLGFN